MRIAFLSTMSRIPWGGSEELWLATAAEALAAGHQVLAGAYRWPDLPAPLARLRDAGARLDLRPRSRRYRRSAILTWIRDPFAAVARFDPDVVCVSQGGTFDIGRPGEMAALWRGRAARGWPYVLLCQCEQDTPAPAIRKRCARAFAGAAAVGFLGARPQREAERQLGLPIPAGRTIQNPFTLGAPGVLPWPGGSTLRFLFVGRLEAVKGAHLIVEALSGPAWRARDWRLTVAGDGSQRAALAALARARGIADRVVFPGFVPDIGRAWRDHHALILPSRAEGLPLVMIEAMLCGRPVVATPAGSVAEWLDDGVGGFLVERPDTPALVAALERVWTRRAELDAMGRAAYDRATRLRDPDPARTLLRWLEEAAAPAGSRPDAGAKVSPS